LSWVAQGGKLVKMLRTIKSRPFKAWRLPREGWPRDELGCPSLSPLDQLGELVPEGPQISLRLFWL